MKRMVSLLLCVALCLVSMPICASASEIEGDVWDGSITQPTKLVQKEGVYY